MCLLELPKYDGFGGDAASGRIDLSCVENFMGAMYCYEELLED